ncbi:MAG: STAS domain-containing protein [Bacteroidales bacterium]|nr:STAS domain-containing protein [Bacteroidales bacterium]
MKTEDKNIQIKPSNKKGESSVSIIIENELTIFSVESMKDKIIEAVTKYDHIGFVLKTVNNMDLTFIQLLYSVKKTAETRNKKVSFDVELSDDIKTLFNNSDLSKVLI